MLIQRFEISAAMAAALVSSMFFANILAQLPFGVALDRYGTRYIVTTCVMLIALGTALFAWNQTYELTLVSRIVIGIGLASMGAATHIIIARNFSTENFGYVSGLVVTLGGIGGLLGTYPLAIALSKFPWEGVFSIASVVTLILAILIFFALRAPRKGEHKTLANNKAGSYLDLLRDPEYCKVLALAVVTYAPIVTITGLWGGPFLQDIAGFSPEDSGAIIFLFFCATIGAGAAFGHLDKWAKSRFWLILGAAACSTTCLLLLAILSQPEPHLAVMLLLTMIFFQQFYIPLSAHMRRIVPDHLLGQASTLFSFTAVAAIPTLQIGFGTILDIAKKLGLEGAQQYRLAFAAMAVLMTLCSLIYATSRKANAQS